MQIVRTEDTTHEAHDVEFVEMARDSEFERTEWFRCHDCGHEFARRDWQLVDVDPVVSDELDFVP